MNEDSHKPPQAPSGQRRLVHWCSAVLVIATLCVGLWMVRNPVLGTARAIDGAWWFSLHKTLGVFVLLITVWRLIATIRDPFPGATAEPHEMRLAALTQGFMLAALVFLPVIGLVQHTLVKAAAPIWGLPEAWFAWAEANPGLSHLVAAAHRALAWALLGALALHAAGALKHHFIDRSDVLHRMISGNSSTPKHETDPPIVNEKRLGAFGAALAICVALTAAFTATAEKKPNADIAGQKQPAQSLQPWTWRVDRKKSRLTIAATQDGQAFTALFTSFDVKIVFDPDNLPKAVIAASIAANSFSSGLPDRDTIARDTEWLDAKNHPLAHWRMTKVTRTTDGRYDAEGVLTIRGISAPVVLAFNLNITGNKAKADGTASFDRTKLQLGRGEYQAVERAGHTIKVQFSIEADRVDTK